MSSAAIPVLSHVSEPGPIPRVLHQVWVGSPVPSWVQHNWDLWEEMHPDWTFMRWTDENSDQWPLSRLASSRGLPHVVVLADLIRLEQVWKFGGIYADSDTIPLRSLDEMVGNRAPWIAQGGWEPPADSTKEHHLNNAIFGFPPRHAFPTAVWNRAIGRLDRKSAFHIAGPKAFEDLYATSASEGVELPPWTTFPDLPAKMKKEGIPPTLERLREEFPDALVVHTANKSWYGANHSIYQTPTFIMAVPWVAERKERAEDLSVQTSGKIVWDSTHHAFTTWRDVLRALGKGPGIIIEDDVVLARDWRNRVEAVIKEHPDTVIQFFSMRQKDLTVGSRLEPGSSFMMNQCYYLPAGVAQALLEFTDNWAEEHPEHPTGYDIAMAEWMKANRQRYWLQVPSLVDHEPWRSEINTKRPRNRQSLTFESHAGLPQAHILHVPGFDEDRDAQVRRLVSEMGACVHEDPTRRGVVPNFIEALECANGSGHEWNLILQDDAAPFPAWDHHLVQVMQHAPEESVAVGLTHFGSYGEKLWEKGKSFGLGVNAIWGCASMYRAERTVELLDFAQYAYKVGFWGDDSTVAAYNLHYGLKTALTSRALFDHRPYKSTLGHSARDKMRPSSTIERFPDEAGWDLGVAAAGTSVAPDSRELARMFAAGETGPILKDGAWRK